MNPEQQTEIRELIQQRLPEAWRPHKVVDVILFNIRSYYEEIILGGHARQDIVEAAIGAIELPDDVSRQIGFVIKEMFHRESAVQRIREDPDKYLHPKDSWRQYFQELEHINRQLDRAGEANGRSLRERWTKVWDILYATLTREEFLAAIPHRDLYDMAPDQLDEIAGIFESAPRLRGKVGDEMLNAGEELLQNLPPNALQRLESMGRQYWVRWNREQFAFRIRAAMINLLPPVQGKVQPEANEHGEPQRPEYWKKVQTHFLKEVGDKSPGLE